MKIKYNEKIIKNTKIEKTHKIIRYQSEEKRLT